MTGKDADQGAIDNAWRIHGTIADWTKGVDSKASFVLTIEIAVLAGVISLMGGNRQLAELQGSWENTFLYAGIAALVLAIVLVAWAVRPRTRPTEVEREAPKNFIYFGHLRHWRADDLEDALKHKEILPVLSRQLVAMSEIAWKKHTLLKWSLTAAMIGTILVGSAAVLA